MYCLASAGNGKYIRSERQIHLCITYVRAAIDVTNPSYARQAQLDWSKIFCFVMLQKFGKELSKRCLSSKGLNISVGCSSQDRDRDLAYGWPGRAPG